MIKPIVAFVILRTEQVKVPSKEPGARNVRGEISEIFQEGERIPMVSGCVDVSDSKKNVSDGGSENRREGVFPCDEAVESEGVSVPSSKNSASRTSSIYAVKIPKAGW
jgi:hypothetical protein